MAIDFSIGNILIVSAVIAFIITYAAIPSIIRVVQRQQWFDEPERRKVHTQKTPTLGGLAVFAGTIISSSLFINNSYCGFYPFMVAAAMIVFFIGIKDDILMIAPATKLGGEILAAFIIVVLGDLRFTHLHGFFDIFEIPYWISILITMFFIIVVINSFNLIDGIDGLCSGISIVTASTFGIWFYLVEEFSFALFAFTLVGGLLAFFRFNFFSTRNKIFMGDTGSLLVGLLIAILTIRFNELNIDPYYQYGITSAPSVSFAILIIPLFDVLRVLLIRLIARKGLFRADKNHMHHRLLSLNLSHQQATLWILAVNLFFIFFAFYFKFISIRRLLLIILLLAMFFSYIPTFILERRRKREKPNETN